MSFLQKKFLDLKKTIHFIHFGVRPADLCGVTFMLWGGDGGCGHVATIMLRFYKNV